jgi:hypothetical protein
MRRTFLRCSLRRQQPWLGSRRFDDHGDAVLLRACSQPGACWGAWRYVRYLAAVHYFARATDDGRLRASGKRGQAIALLRGEARNRWLRPGAWPGLFARRGRSHRHVYPRAERGETRQISDSWYALPADQPRSSPDTARLLLADCSRVVLRSSCQPVADPVAI